jgi:hypothetical protein
MDGGHGVQSVAATATSERHTDANLYRNSDRDEHRDANRDSDRHCYFNGHNYGNGYADSHCDWFGDASGHRDRYCNGNSGADATERNRYANAASDLAWQRDSNANTDGDRGYLGHEHSESDQDGCSLVFGCR